MALSITKTGGSIKTFIEISDLILWRLFKGNSGLVFPHIGEVGFDRGGGKLQHKIPQFQVSLLTLFGTSSLVSSDQNLCPLLLPTLNVSFCPVVSSILKTSKYNFRMVRTFVCAHTFHASHKAQFKHVRWRWNWCNQLCYQVHN